MMFAASTKIYYCIWHNYIIAVEYFGNALFSWLVVEWSGLLLDYLVVRL